MVEPLIVASVRTEVRAAAVPILIPRLQLLEAVAHKVTRVAQEELADLLPMVLAEEADLLQ